MIFLPSSLIPLCVVMCFLTMVIQRTHILMTLLALEAMILNLMLFSLISLSSSSFSELFITMIILTFGACEAALGLSCLVLMTRSFGNDMISSSAISSC